MDKQNVEGWLDTALRTRVDAEPRIGLEDRVLARLAGEPQRRTLVRWPVFAALAAGLVIFVAFAITRVTTPRREITTVAGPPPAVLGKTGQPAIQAGRMPSKQAQGVGSLVSRGGRRGAPDAARPAVNRDNGLPRLATFPSSRPETAQERVLGRLAARRDSYEVASNSADEMVALKDLSVPELNIKPLEGTPTDHTPQQ